VVIRTAYAGARIESARRHCIRSHFVQKLTGFIPLATGISKPESTYHTLVQPTGPFLTFNRVLRFKLHSSVLFHVIYLKDKNNVLNVLISIFI
jgi:hypothetical protein